MKKVLMMLAVLLLACAAATAEELPVTAEELVGVWRFAGGAEVAGYGFELRADGTMVCLTTDDFDHFPPERLIPLSGPAMWELQRGQLVRTVDGKRSRNAIWQAGETPLRIHLDEGDGGGYYEKCDASLVVQLSSPLPMGVQEWMEEQYPGWTLEDFILVGRGSEGFALLRAEGVRHLLGVTYQQKQWRVFADIERGVPQSERRAHLSNQPAGESRERLWTDEAYLSADGRNVSVEVAGEEYMLESVTYAVQDGVWQLREYRFGPNAQAEVLEGSIMFYGVSGDGDEECPAAIETWMTEVDFASLPRRAADVKSPSTPTPRPQSSTAIPTLAPVSVRLRPDLRLPVYQGPGSHYPRTGSKALMSTNGWYECYGEYNGYLLVCYDVSKTRHRYGWVDKSALAEGWDAPSIDFARGHRGRITVMCTVTDDPLLSRDGITIGMPDTEAELLSRLGSWYYARFTDYYGQERWGFIPQTAVKR